MIAGRGCQLSFVFLSLQFYDLVFSKALFGSLLCFVLSTLFSGRYNSCHLYKAVTVSDVKLGTTPVINYHLLAVTAHIYDCDDPLSLMISNRPANPRTGNSRTHLNAQSIASYNRRSYPTLQELSYGLFCAGQIRNTMTRSSTSFRCSKRMPLRFEIRTKTSGTVSC